MDLNPIHFEQGGWPWIWYPDSPCCCKHCPRPAQVGRLWSPRTVARRGRDAGGGRHARPQRGLKIFGVGMHHDPLRSTWSRPVTSWGLSWVSLGVILRLPFRPDHNYYLPLLFRLYQNKTAAAKSRRRYRSRPELAVELLHLLFNRRKNRRFHVVADSAYGGQSVLCNLPENCGLTSRLLPTARLYAPPRHRASARLRPGLVQFQPRWRYDFHWQALACQYDCALLGPAPKQPEKKECQMWCNPRNGLETRVVGQPGGGRPAIPHSPALRSV